MIEDAIIDEKVDNLNVSSLSVVEWKNIIEVANRLQVGSSSIPL